MASETLSADATSAPGGGALAILCGGGSFPGAVAEAVKQRGRRPVMFPIRGWADPAVMERYAHHWIAIGQAGRLHFDLIAASHQAHRSRHRSAADVALQDAAQGGHETRSR